MKLAGMVEYWIMEYWIKNRNRSIFIFKLRSNPIKKNPFIHYSIIPLFQTDETARQEVLKLSCHKKQKKTFKDLIVGML
jgi:hypothetical protein